MLAIFSKVSNDTVYFDVLRTLDMLGLIEVSERSGQMRWSSNLDAGKPVEMSSFLSPNMGGVPFRFGFSDLDFDLKSIESLHAVNIEVFQKSILSTMPEFSKVMEKCTSARNWSEYVGEMEIEAFDFDKGWRVLPSYLVSKPSLIKRKLDSGGFEFMLAFPNKNEAKKIIYGEWAFLLAMGIEQRDLTGLVRNGYLKLKSPIRLPSILNRFLLSYSSEVRIDYGIQFKLNSEQPINTLNAWLGTQNVSM